MKKTKKWFSLLLSLVVLLSITAFSASALAEEGDSAFQYELLEDGTAMITAYTGTASDVTVPAVIDGHAVYGIASGTFQEKENVQTITLESGITYVDYSAFGYCPNLRSVRLCDTVEKVETNAFIYCPKLETITVDTTNPVYDSRNGCNGLVETATNTFIAGGSRSAIPEGIVRIESNAFHGCTSLTEITIPNTVKTIGWYAFTDTGLKSIYIPANTTEFEYLGFLGQFGMFKSSELEEINVDADNPLYASLDGVLFNKDKTQILYYPQGKKDAVYVLPNTVTAIMGGGETFLTPFDQPEYLQNIIFPQSVTYFASGVVATDDVFTENNVSVTVLNSNCQFDGKSFNGVETVYGFANSTTEDSSKERHYNFVALDAPSGQGIVPEQTDSVYTSGSDRRQPSIAPTRLTICWVSRWIMCRCRRKIIRLLPVPRFCSCTRIS